MDAVEGSREDEHFVGGEVVERGGACCWRSWGGGGRGGVLRRDEVSVVEERAGFGDDEEGEDGPVRRVRLKGWRGGELGDRDWTTE